MNKITSIIITLGLIVALFIIFSGGDKKINGDNIEIRDGIQYIRINAKGGYSPNVSTAKAGIPTKLIVKTNDTYDCSAALAIKSINYQKILPQNGETEIDLGTSKVGEPIQGLCGMGMYGFKINFQN